MGLIKTYRRDEAGVLHYREAWKDRSLLVVHEGKVGTKGKTSHQSTKGRPVYRQHLPTMGERIRAFEEQAAADGFRQVPDDEQGWVVLQCWTHSPDLSHPDDARLFEEGADALDGYLGWRGAGHYDGNDLGGSPPAAYELAGTVLNMFCKVVDTEPGVEVVRGFAREFGLTQLHVIASREPGEDSPYTLAWSPRKRDKEFDLFGL